MMKHIPTIIIRVIDHNQQEYDTAGNYFEEGGVWNITISKMGFWHELFCAIHELYELCVCLHRGIKNDAITEFDLNNIEHPDPGMLPDAPYHKEHIAALAIEKSACLESKQNWTKHDNQFGKLKWHEPK